RFIMPGIGRGGNDALPIGKALAEAGDDLPQEVYLADADAVEPGDRPFAGSPRNATEPLRAKATQRLLTKPRLPQKPGREGHPRGDVDQVQKVRGQARVLSPLASRKRQDGKTNAIGILCKAEMSLENLRIDPYRADVAVAAGAVDLQFQHVHSLNVDPAC